MNPQQPQNPQQPYPQDQQPQSGGQPAPPTPFGPAGMPGQQQSGQQSQSQGDNQPQLVYMARPHEPIQPEMSPEARKRHEDSKKDFPHLNLSEGEYVISVVDRHPIGLLGIWIASGLVIFVLVVLMALVSGGALTSELGGESTIPVAVLAIPVLLISFLVLIFAFIATIVYNANRFFLTNESVIQHIQTSLFSKREQTVSLANVEDASFTQDGILPHLLNYGMIRLSTQGDETTYRFQYASNPQKTISILNNAVEAFKNGRPVTAEDSRNS